MARRLDRGGDARIRRHDTITRAARIRDVGDAIDAAADWHKIATEESGASAAERNASEVAPAARAPATTARPLADQPVGEGQKSRATHPGPGHDRPRPRRPLLGLSRCARLRSRGRSPLINGTRALSSNRSLSHSDERLLLAMESIGTARERIAHNAAPCWLRGDGPGPAAASLESSPRHTSGRPRLTACVASLCSRWPPSCRPPHWPAARSSMTCAAPSRRRSGPDVPAEAARGDAGHRALLRPAAHVGQVLRWAVCATRGADRLCRARRRDDRTRRSHGAGDLGLRGWVLVVNPGGPAGRAWTTRGLRPLAPWSPPPCIAEHDVVGFDPRGVRRSAPIDRLDGAQLDAFMAQDPTPTPMPSGQQPWPRPLASEACAAKDNPLLHVSTAEAAGTWTSFAPFGRRQAPPTWASPWHPPGRGVCRLFPEHVGRRCSTAPSTRP